MRRMGNLKPEQIYESVEFIVNAPAGDREFKGPAVPAGRVVKIETFYLVDESTAAKEITLGMCKGNVIHVLRHETCGTGIYGLSLLTPLILVEGVRPYAKITSATLNVELNFVVRGVYL